VSQSLLESHSALLHGNTLRCPTVHKIVVSFMSSQSPEQRNGGADVPRLQRKVRRTAERAAATWRADSAVDASDRSDDEMDAGQPPAGQQDTTASPPPQEWPKPGHFGSYVAAAAAPEAYSGAMPTSYHVRQWITWVLSAFNC